MAQIVKNLSAMQESQFQTPGRKEITTTPTQYTYWVEQEKVCPKLANAGDVGLIPGLGKSSGKENGNPLQYSCLGNPMNRGAWQATAHGVAKSRT